MPYVRKTKKTVRPMRKVKTHVPATIKKYVKTMINKDIEDKYAQYFSTNFPILQHTGTAGTNQYQFYNNALGYPLQALAQGVGQGNRIGNQVNIKEWKISCILTSYGYDSPTTLGCPMLYVRVICGYRKDMNLPSLQLGDIFQDGNNAVGPSANIIDSVSRINKDAYHLFYDKEFKLGTAATVPTGNGFYPAWNNDFKQVNRFTIDLTKHFKNAKVTYSDNGAMQIAKIGAMFIAFITTNGDGTSSTPLAAATQSCGVVTIQNDILFQDA